MLPPRFAGFKSTDTTVYKHSIPTGLGYTSPSSGDPLRFLNLLSHSLLSYQFGKADARIPEAHT
ncbi:MAG: hypothetical protein ABR568_22630, partial [Pyrinomonadaceae bacterium]